MHADHSEIMHHAGARRIVKITDFSGGTTPYAHVA
jgi:hypothetical protein